MISPSIMRFATISSFPVLVEVEVDPGQPSLPWRQLFSDPDCGIFLVLGQSNAANHGDTLYLRGETSIALIFYACVARVRMIHWRARADRRKRVVTTGLF